MNIALGLVDERVERNADRFCKLEHGFKSWIDTNSGLYTRYLARRHFRRLLKVEKGNSALLARLAERLTNGFCRPLGLAQACQAKCRPYETKK